jgi:tetratricopeptide (TPR) repeat protein
MSVSPCKPGSAAAAGRPRQSRSFASSASRVTSPFPAKLRDVAIDRASVLRNAEKLLRQGKLDAAVAEYVRIVEDQPHDWNTANALGDLYLRSGQSDRAVEQYVRIADSLSREGFFSKAAALYKKILKIRPDDEHALLQAGEMAASQGLLLDARTFLNAVVQRRVARGDHAGVATVRSRLFAVYFKAGDLERAREFATTAEALNALGQAFAARGDTSAAAEFLTAETAGTDTELLLKIAQAQLAAGAVDGGLAMLRQVLNQDATRSPLIAEVAWGIAASAPDTALRVVEIVVETAIIEADWTAAARLLAEFVDRVPNHVPALRRLVEVSFDGGLETAMFEAQSRLVDAYLLTGSPAEARVIAEDLVTRGADPLHVEQLRRALIMLGEADPDRAIADCLAQIGDDEPSTLGLLGENVTGVDPVQPEMHADEPIGDPGLQPAAAAPDQAVISPFDEPADDAIEIDLSDALAEFTMGSAPAALPPPRNLDEVFERLREDGALSAGAAAARIEYDRAIALRQSGRIDDSIRGFEAASRDPGLRLQASVALAHVYQERQDRPRAVEWLEQAVQSPAVDAEETHALFFELADTLEAMGECERALAVCLELQSEAGDYRDVPQRIRRLTRARG